MLTQKDYCDYNTCVALKELGFDSLVDWYFKEDKSIASSLARYRNTYIPRISLYEAQKWLREEKRINIFVAQIPIENSNNFRYVAYIQLGESAIMTPCSHTYEEALLEGIKEAVKILKEK